MRTLKSYNFYSLTNWWLSKGFLFKELFSWAAGLVASALIFGVLGVHINNRLIEPTTKFAVWTIIGFIIFKLFFSIGTAVAQEYVKMKTLSVYDTLTGLKNRNYIPEAVRITFAQAQRNGECFCVFEFDGNNIKDINDTYGHDAGDYAIIKIAKKIRELIYRSDDIIIRPGGDEFIVICCSKDPQKMYERIIEDLSAQEILMKTDGSQPPLKLSMAVGLSSIPITGEFRRKNPQDIYNFLYKQADKKMYEHKESQKNAASDNELE